MKIRNKIEKNYVAAGCYMCLASFALLSCSEEWNDHYDRGSNLPMESLMDIVNSDSHLTKFGQILKATGYDSILTSDQTYTVWAPVDEALAFVDMNDSNALLRLVRNHIARYSNPTSIPETEKIYMLNGKSMAYSGDFFNGAELLEKNIVAKNGILHKLDTQIPYKFNIMEYISTDNRFSDMYDFISSFNEQRYSPEFSTTYDSVFVNYNQLLEDKLYGIGSISNEDSIYTMIIPDNEAWRSAYEHIKPYFRTYNKEQNIADSVQHVQTCLAILGGLTFRGLVSDVASYDSLFTVTENVIRPVSEYFSGYNTVDASNGLLYVASANLNLNDTCVWNHKIDVEAEDMDSRINLSSTNSYIRNTDINSLVAGVSNSSYLEVSSGNVDGGVIFDVANTLAGKYDVYVDFVSPLIDGENMVNEITKVSFQLRYRNENGRTSTLNNNTGVDVGGEEQTGIISVKAFENVSLPVADFYDGMWFLDEKNSAADIVETTTLQVKTKVSSSDARKGYVRKFRVDRVRFVPVLE
ncbi:MAG: fasciclin domain-containing protein [Bacteroides sp.]|nr:fasciclin domain-containing protein [Roseburia sp.]MCM1346123.1 fasciclin domain-containing protein [Bacteroides sp.]MCM1420888.1 fasciclin domain-containing protein [Bacteroides sp.]